MKQMTDAYKDKKQFIEKSLSKVMTEATKGAVVSLTYDLVGYDEVVTITYDNGYTKKARVNGDSKWGCIMDIMNVISY